MIVLGIDPGLATTGYAVVEDQANTFVLHDSGLIRTKPRIPLPERLKQIFETLSQVGNRFSVQEMSCEKLFFSRNVKTAIQVAQARGVVLLYGAMNNLPVFEYTPSNVKMCLTGYGSADKKQMQKMVRLLLNLEKAPKVDDEADAMGIAICHLQNRRMACLNT